MENIILEFDKRIIEKSEMIEHINYYSSNAERAMSLHSEGKIKEAREIFKDLREKLKLENKYYSKASVEKYISKDILYHTYSEGVYRALANQIRPNSNETLFSNLYDIRDYITNYEMRIFLEN